MGVGFLVIGRKRPGFDAAWGAAMEAAVRASVDPWLFPCFWPATAVVDDASLAPGDCRGAAGRLRSPRGFAAHHGRRAAGAAAGATLGRSGRLLGHARAARLAPGQFLLAGGNARLRLDVSPASAGPSKSFTAIRRPSRPCNNWPTACDWRRSAVDFGGARSAWWASTPPAS